MKSLRGITALLLVLLLTTVFAGAASADSAPTKGTITIERQLVPVENQSNYYGNPMTAIGSYSLYRLFDATLAFDDEGNVTGISYTCTEQQKAVDGFDTYFVTSGNNVTGVTPAATGENNSLSAAAVQWVKENIADLGTPVTGFTNAPSSTRIYFKMIDGIDPNGNPVYEMYYKVFNLPFGYYYVDSTVGSLVMIDSTQPDATISDKNEAPSLEKEITEITSADGNVINPDAQGHSLDIQEGNSAGTVQIGDTVSYSLTVTANPGSEYILSDSQSYGLTMDPNSLKVTVDGQTLPSSCYTLYTSPNPGMLWSEAVYNREEGIYYYHLYKTAQRFDYSRQDKTLVKENLFTNITAYANEEYNFVIIFDQTYLNNLEDSVKIKVTYDCVVNQYASVTQGSNPNYAILQYGHRGFVDFRRLEDDASVYSARIRIYKYEGDGDSSSSAGNKPLGGVKFVLKNSAGKYLNQNDDTRVVTWVTDKANATEFVTNDYGFIQIEGLTNGTYTLEETYALPGYNRAEDVEVTIDNRTVSENLPPLNTYPRLQVQADIANKTGSVLPHTGGIGVTVFYAAGAILLLGMAYALIRKRRIGET